LAGFGWVWLGLAGFRWVSLGLVGFSAWGLVDLGPSRLVSRPVRRSARAPLLRSTRAPAGRARTTSGRVNARRAQRDGRSAREVRARHALGARGPRFRAPGVCVSGLCCSPLPALRARRSVYSRSARSGERSLRASARRTRCATHATRPARGERAPPAQSE